MLASSLCDCPGTRSDNIIHNIASDEMMILGLFPVYLGKFRKTTHYTEDQKSIDI